ncbi:MAG: TonB-dependent receptor [Deltaproteobacteria bacterium]|nr:MAG: TonB-dependent receptor [Deltaproteobacteria bacterium]
MRVSLRSWHGRLLCVVALFLAAPASAQSWVAFLHTPPEVQPAGSDLVLAGSVIGLGKGQEVDVVYRSAATSGYRRVPVRAAFGDTWQAVIPGRDVAPPFLEYYVEVRSASGARQAIFASAQAPQRVPVQGATAPVATEGRAAPPASRTESTPPPETPGATPREAEDEEAALYTAEAPPPPAHAPPAQSDRAPPRRPPARAAPPAAPAEDNELLEELALFTQEDPVTLATLDSQSVTRAPAIVSVISDEEMRAMGARTLVEVLKTIPGLEVSRDVQGFWRLAVRGIRSDAEVLLLYDGHRLGNLYDARQLYELPVEHLERVEVIRGPGSALYGTGAFLAVVNLVPSSRGGLSLAGSIDSFGVGSAHAGYGLDLGRGRLRFEIDFEGGKGYSKPVETDAFRDSGAGHVDDGHALVQGAVRGTHAAPGGEITWSLRAIHQDRRALLGAFDVVGPNSWLLWSVFLGDISYRLALDSGELTFRLRGDLQDVRRRFQITPEGYDTGQAVFERGIFEITRHQTASAGFDLTGRFELFPGNVLTVGSSLEQGGLLEYAYLLDVGPAGEKLDAPATPPGISPPAEGLTQRLSIGLFVQDQWRLGEDLDLVAGLRGDLFLGGVGRDDPAAPPGEQGLAVSINPRLGFVWSPSEAWTFKALAGTAYRVPTFEELTSQLPENDLARGRFEGNPTLDPVRIQTAELGAEHRFAAGSHRVRLRANAFANQFLGRIEAVDLTGNVTPLFNRDGAILVFGAEGEGRVDFGPRDWLSIGGAWFRGIDTQAPPGRNLLTDVPQLRFILQANVGLGAYFDLHARALLGAERRNLARSSLEALRRFAIPPYALLDFTLRTTPIGGVFSVALSVQNALDVPYQDDVPRPDRVPGLLPGPGLSARLTLRSTF